MKMKKVKLRDGTVAWIICDLRDFGKCESDYPLIGAYSMDGIARSLSWTVNGRQLASCEGPLDLMLPFEFEGTGLYKNNHGDTVHIVWIHDNGSAIGYWIDPDLCQVAHTFDKDGRQGSRNTFLVRKLTAEEALNEDQG